jgi:cell division protein YceG involved in septum cleavage
VVVEPGTDAGTILGRLEEEGVIADARIARAWLIYGEGDPPLHAGEYRFELPLTPREALRKMIEGDVVLHQVTVIEGLTLEETAQALADADFGDLDAFLAAMRDPAPIADLDPEAENLEGYLYPETYSFPRGTSEAEIVQAMVAAFRTTFEEEVRPLLGNRLILPGEPAGEPKGESRAADRATEGAAGAEARALEGVAERRAGPEEPKPGAGETTGTVGEEAAAEDVSTPDSPPDEPPDPIGRPVDENTGGERRWTVRELVTLASIVEKEARVEEERGQIAAVYANRLAAGMGLYADPTVIYALRLRGEYDGNLTRENLRVDSPYNTYRYAGLPPGPIASPGRGSLRAAADPAEVPYLYFVSRNDGTHVFSRTLSEHNRNVQQWQKQYWRDRWAEERRNRQQAGEQEDSSPPTD